MNRFTAFVIKEFRHILRDKRTLLILFGMPVVQIMLFGYAITNEIKDANIAILDYSKDIETQKITNKILSSGYFRLYDNLDALPDIEEAFKSGKVKQVLVFEPNFAENLQKEGTAKIQVMSDATDPNTATTLLNYTNSIIADYNKSNAKSTGVSPLVSAEMKMRYNEEVRGAFMFVPGLITILMMLVSAMMTSISLTREKETGTMEVLLVSPMKPFQVIIAKVTPYLVLAFIDAIVILLLGVFVFGVPIRGSLVFLLSEIALFVLTSLSIGILISTITDSQQAALMISLMGLMMPTILLSGFIYPIDNMPVALQYFTMVIPARWFNVIIRSIMLKGVGIEMVWKETLMLVGFLVLIIGLSVKKYKVRL